MRNRYLFFAIALLLLSLSSQAAASPRVDPELTARLAVAPAATRFGVILTFYGDHITNDHVAAVQALGITSGVRMVNFPIMGVPATAAQIQQMMNWPQLRSIYLNAPLQLNLHQSKALIGVDRLRTDIALTSRNGGLPVSGHGITIAINDSGIDGSHGDLTFNPANPSAGKTIQNVIINPNDKDGLPVRVDPLGNPLEGILPTTVIENVINTDTNVGHGTHCASIAAGTGQLSSGLYQGVAPGAKLLGLGSGAVLFVLGQVAAFDYCFTHQYDYNIRVVNCSWGNSAVPVDPDHPVNVASKRLHDQSNIVIVFANGNDGPRPNSQNRWASVPWIISAGAATKEGRLAGFSSRGIFGDPVIHPTVITPGTGSSAAGFTSDIIAARASTNLVANGADADLQIPTAFVPFYTQISGTSMAAPHLAGIVANILEAKPSLSVDEVKSILERTATPLATYDEFEVGAGLANVHAAVDLAFNPQKAYGNFGFTGKGFTVQRQDGGSYQGTVPARGTTTQTFTIPANARFTFVQLDWDGAVVEGQLVFDNTNIAINDLALTVLNGATQVASSNATNLAALYGSRESVKLEFPQAGTYTARISGGFPSGQGLLLDQPYRLSVTSYVYDPGQLTDLGGLDNATKIKALRLVYDRILPDSGGLFRPNDSLTRMELGRALMFGARVMQYIPNLASFNDLSAGSPDCLIAESLKREGVMGLDGPLFGPGASVSRLDLAVAAIRALRLDAQARALANTNVTSAGQPLVDNSQIPGALRGYVQLALDRGVLQAFPTEVREISPGVFQAVPGPRFEPARSVKRVEFLDPMLRVISLLFGE